VVAQIQAIRGMNDILPPETYWWQYAENQVRRAFHGFGYQEIRFPIVERTELFQRSIGDMTDIVEKEMYTFLDRNNESLTLRPEGTASCVRAALEHGLLHNQTQRLWYGGPYFRYERPQKGRYRQFYQYSAEVFGLPGADIEAELLVMASNLFEKLGIRSMVSLQINSLGSLESRKEHRKALIEYLEKHHKSLDEDALKRLHTNPLRILDSKNPSMKSLIEHAPKLSNYWDKASREHFEKLQSILSQVGIDYEVNSTLVRGLDYYNHTVFEWVTTHLGAQGTICAGGRYDGLVEQLGGKPTPAAGFAIGMERLILLLQQTEKHYPVDPLLHAYIITDSEEAYVAGLKLANYLRTKVPHLRLLIHCGGGNIKAQFKKADKSHAQYALVIGEHELKKHSVTFKMLREDIPQQTFFYDELAEYLKLRITNKKLHEKNDR